MCCVIPPASPDCTLALRIRSRSEVLPWSTCPITVTTGGFSTRSSGASSGAAAPGGGFATAPTSTSTPISEAISSISSVESVCVTVFISPKDMSTLITAVGATPRASAKSFPVALDRSGCCSSLSIAEDPLIDRLLDHGEVVFYLHTFFSQALYNLFCLDG